VSIADKMKSAIGQGLMILVGICDEDNDEDIEYLCQKVVKMRIFDDAEGVMNLPITEVENSSILVVSQFTLMASTKKGNRPSYIHASKPDFAVPMYEKFIARLQQLFGKEVQTGEFGADMQVALVNDGPVTIMMDSHLREAF
jgi:D-tyrosyl-tRNA(Tyr) deacylase